MKKQKNKVAKEILLVCPFSPPNIGGVEAHLKSYLEFLSEEDIPATLLSYNPLVTKTQWNTLDVYGSVKIRRFWWFTRIPFGRRKEVPLFERLVDNPFFEYIYLVPKLLFHVLIYVLKNRKNIHCYHAHGLAAASIISLIKFIVPRKSIVSTHYIYGLKDRAFFSYVFLWIFNKFDIVLAVGEKSKLDLADVGYSKNKIKVYRHSINNQSLFVPSSSQLAKTALKLNPNDKTVLFVGRLVEMKGIPYLIDAAKIMTDTNFIFVGDGEMREILYSYDKKMANLLFLGKRHGYNLVEAYNAADMVILPSVEEGQSLVVIEALSCGKPVIITEKGDSKDMFPNNLGRKISPSVKTIIDAIYSIQSEDLEHLAKDCRNYAMKTYGKNNLRMILRSSL